MNKLELQKTAVEVRKGIVSAYILQKQDIRPGKRPAS